MPLLKRALSVRVLLPVAALVANFVVGSNLMWRLFDHADFLHSWFVRRAFSGVWFLTVLQIFAPWLAVVAILRRK
jgi:hypothetical protein